MSSRFEPTSQQARSIPLLGYRKVSAPHAGLFSQLAPVRSGPGGGGLQCQRYSAGAATVSATAGREGCG
jgi:hypothetical protein